ncbi:hypothetical protein B0E38_04961 [Streptomyces sp. 111WW2]|nr:hypothetical protein B0E38_04961 [Streptomyces sp. 111WW2]
MVSHMANGSPVGPFYSYVDGYVRMSYDEEPYCRGGSHPDDLLDVMRKVGFGPMEGPDPDPDEDEDEVKSLTRAKFALAHHVTGVRLTRRLLETAEFTCGLVTKTRHLLAAGLRPRPWSCGEARPSLPARRPVTGPARPPTA